MSTSRPLTAEDVLEDITYELAQGTLARDDLAQSIEAVRRHQETMRAALLKPGRAADARDIALRQLQLNDMLLTIVRELALNVRAAQLDVRRVVALPAREPGPQHDAASVAMPAPRRTAPPIPAADPDLASDLQRVLDAGSLYVRADPRPVNLPLIGSLLTRIRGAIHNLPIFYVNHLAAQQTAINQTLAGAMLRLIQASDRPDTPSRPAPRTPEAPASASGDAAADPAAQPPH